MHAGRKTAGSTDTAQRLFDLLLADPALLALPAPSRTLLHDALARHRSAARRADPASAAGGGLGADRELGRADAARPADPVCDRRGAFGQRRAMALALVIYASGMAVAMTVVAVNDHPFAGQDALPPTPLIETLQQFAPR